MQTHGNLTANYLWQPGEFARRMLGERPSPVPPTRELWPPPQQPISISTLHVAYNQDEPYTRRAATLPPQTYVPTTVSVEKEYGECEYYRPERNYHRPDSEYHRPRVCTIGTNTDPPSTIISRLRHLFKKDDNVPIGIPPPGRLTAVPRETAIDSRDEDNRTQRTLSRIKKAISGAKYRIAPGTEAVDSPKISYDISKPGDRMTTTFGAREPRQWCKLPSKESCSRRLRAMGNCCTSKPRRPPRREPHAPGLQITQVWTPRDILEDCNVIMIWKVKHSLRYFCCSVQWSFILVRRKIYWFLT